jgi:flagellar biosynthesis protein FlhG
MNDMARTVKETEELIMDQAHSLREMVQNEKPCKRCYPFIMSVTSGKGGVGKTNVVANLSLSLSLLGRKVMLLDADVGLGNLDVLLGLTPRHTIHHVLNGEKRLAEILVEGPNGIKILPASSGIQELTALEPLQKMNLTAELESVLEGVEILLIDTGAGISSNVMYFNSLAQEILVIVVPEPTSLTDAYALIKVHSRKHAGKRYKILCNSVKNEQEAIQIFRHLSRVTQKFLNVSLDLYGYIPCDKHIPEAIRQQRLLVECFPKSEAARQFLLLARKVEGRLPHYNQGNGEGVCERVSLPIWNNLSENLSEA